MISDELWELIEPVLPSDVGRRGRRWRDHRLVLEAIAWRFRTGAPWRDLPVEFGSWKTAWNGIAAGPRNGTYQRIFARMVADRDAAGALDWLLSADSTVVRGASVRRRSALVQAHGGGIE